MKSKEYFVEVNDEPLHQEVYKNDYVRIYRAILKPGESTNFHRHSKNTLYITLQGGSITTEKMRGAPACPTVVSKRVSLNTRIRLLFQKVFYSYLNIFNGFVFYMPSEKNPVIHKAIASCNNSFNMDLIGIEVLSSNLTKYKKKNLYGKIEIESSDIVVSRIIMNPNQKLSRKELYEDGIIIALSGRLEINGKQGHTILKTGDYYLIDDKSIQVIVNQGLNKMEFIYIICKEYNVKKNNAI